MRITLFTALAVFAIAPANASSNCDKCLPNGKEFRVFLADAQKAQAREELRNKNQRLRYQINEYSWVGVGGKGLKLKYAF